MFTTLMGSARPGSYTIGDVIDTCDRTDGFDIISDPGADYTYTENCTRTYVTNNANNIDSFVTKDMGVDWFDTSFQLQFTSRKINGTGKAVAVFCSVGNVPGGTFYNLDADNDGVALYYGFDNAKHWMWMMDLSNNDKPPVYYFPFAGGGITYWFTWTRTGPATVVQVYDDAARTNLIRTLDTAGTSSAKMRYLTMVASKGDPASDGAPSTYWVEDMVVTSNG